MRKIIAYTGLIIIMGGAGYLLGGLQFVAYAVLLSVCGILTGEIVLSMNSRENGKR